MLYIFAEYTNIISFSLIKTAFYSFSYIILIIFITYIYQTKSLT